MRISSLLTVMALFFLAAFVFASSASTGADSLNAGADEPGSIDQNKSELIEFVESAVAFAASNGKEKAFSEFSNKSGSFVKGELYIYAYDFNGTCLAHPYKPDWISKNKLDFVDSNGVHALKNSIDAAKYGRGFVYFVFPNPSHGNRDEFKIAYVMKVDESWWLGSGIYISCN